MYPRDAATCSAVWSPASSFRPFAAVHLSFFDAMAESRRFTAPVSPLDAARYTGSVPSTKGRSIAFDEGAIAIRRARRGASDGPAERTRRRSGGSRRGLRNAGGPRRRQTRCRRAPGCGGTGRVSVEIGPPTRDRSFAKHTQQYPGADVPVQNVLGRVAFSKAAPGARAELRRLTWLPVPLTRRTPRRLRISVETHAVI